MGGVGARVNDFLLQIQIYIFFWGGVGKGVGGGTRVSEIFFLRIQI